jgi:hypothetical protein
VVGDSGGGLEGKWQRPGYSCATAIMPMCTAGTDTGRALPGLTHEGIHNRAAAHTGAFVRRSHACAAVMCMTDAEVARSAYIAALDGMA